MEHLIDKDALVAEMKKEIKRIYAGREYVGIPSYEESMVMGIQKVEDIINTLEVKGVDLENELNKYFITNNLIAADIQFEPITQMKKCARYFFELGLKASNKAQKGKKVCGLK